MVKKAIKLRKPDLIRDITSCVYESSTMFIKSLDFAFEKTFRNGPEEVQRLISHIELVIELDLMKILL